MWKKCSALKKPASLEDLLKRPQIGIKDLKSIHKIKTGIPESAWQQVEIAVKYSGFIQRQLKDVERFKHLEKIRLPADFNYSVLSGISREIREKLAKFKPLWQCYYRLRGINRHLSKCKKDGLLWFFCSEIRTNN